MFQHTGRHAHHRSMIKAVFMGFLKDWNLCYFRALLLVEKRGDGLTPASIITFLMNDRLHGVSVEGDCFKAVLALLLEP